MWNYMLVGDADDDERRCCVLFRSSLSWKLHEIDFAFRAHIHQRNWKWKFCFYWISLLFLLFSLFLPSSHRGNPHSELIFSGPNILMEFNSGYQIPPFDYNGFSASLSFIEGATTTKPPPTPSFERHEPHHHEPPHEVATPPPKFTACDQVKWCWSTKKL